jgi:hypothetical protein
MKQWYWGHDRHKHKYNEVDDDTILEQTRQEEIINRGWYNAKHPENPSVWSEFQAQQLQP